MFGALPYLTVEVVILFCLLRPVSYNLSWGRAVVAWAVFAGWFYYVSLGAMHSPGWYVANLVWLFMVLLGLSALVFFTVGIVAIRKFKRAQAST